MSRLFTHMIEIYVIEKYKDIHPQLTGSELTDACILDCLTEYLQCDCHHIEVKRTGKGKPYVDPDSSAQGGSEVYFSVSHSGTYFVCAVADVPIGVDIQKKRKANITGIGQRYFSQKERAYIEEHGDESFFTIWTRKEAYSKYTGRGLEEIMKGTEVLDREDVEFFEFLLGEEVYGAYCIRRGKEE